MSISTLIYIEIKKIAEILTSNLLQVNEPHYSYRQFWPQRQILFINFPKFNWGHPGNKLMQNKG